MTTTTTTLHSARPRAVTDIYESILHRLKRQNCVLFNELDYLNDVDFEDPEKGKGSKQGREYSFEISTTNPRVKLFAWAFKEPVFRELMRLFGAGRLSVYLVPNPKIMSLLTSPCSSLPLFVGHRQITRPRTYDTTFWILLRVTEGTPVYTGRWMAGIHKQCYRFEWLPEACKKRLEEQTSPKQ